MKLAVLGSGSRGNAIALRANGTTLLVDAGFGPRTLARRAADAGLALEPLAGIVLTHEHQDHARGAVPLQQRTGAPVLASAGTLSALAPPGPAVSLAPLAPRVVGAFTVTACHAVHDAAEPCALVVEDGSGIRVGVAYDLGRATSAVRYLLRDCTVLFVEANHDDVLLRTGPYPASVRQRIAGSGGHLSNRAAAELVADLLHPGLGAVVLMHVSEQCNSPELAERTVGQRLRRAGYRGTLAVAHQRTPLRVRFGHQMELGTR